MEPWRSGLRSAPPTRRHATDPALALDVVACPLALTQAQYDEYEQQAMAAYAARKGAKSMTFSDQSVTFDTWEDIWKWLLWLKSQIPGAVRTRYAATSKGV